MVWAFTDGKAGHENQTRGLLERARPSLHPVDTPLDHACPPVLVRAHQPGMTRRFLPGAGLPPPALLVGAGHRTHLPLLAARRARSAGRAVVLMKPSLPRAWFDLCVIPGARRRQLARMCSPRAVRSTQCEPGRTKTRRRRADPDRWPVASPRLGGARSSRRRSRPSWRAAPTAPLDADHIAAAPRRHHRAPAGTQGRQPERGAGARHQAPAWLPEQLAGADQRLVSEDSVSMVYEALTAGCATGILAVPARRASPRHPRHRAAGA
ncbi:MAG: mitochondrial fission ELM1 family protein [Chromatiales bacterium]|nr:mitochondrial fission ELM1 family protein [Chromatiales bacterium]